MAQPDRAMLILRQGSTVDQRWVIDKGEVTLGRSPDNDLVFPDREISRHHARICRQGRECIIEDLGSKNGTFVNDERLTRPRVLQDGDEIQIAPRFRLTFVDAEATAPVPYMAMGLGLRLDPETRKVTVRGQELIPPLSVGQYNFLELLSRQPGRVYSRSEVIAAVWPDALEAGVTDQAIDALVRRIRERLAEVDPHHQYIVTIRGHGFRLEQPG